MAPDTPDNKLYRPVGPVLHGIFVFKHAMPQPVPNWLIGKSLSFSRDMGALFSNEALHKGQEHIGEDERQP